MAHKSQTLFKRKFDKISLSNMRMRKNEPLGLKLQIIVNKQIEVDDPIGIPFATTAFTRTSHPLLNLLSKVKERQRLQCGADYRHSIRKAMFALKTPWLALDIGRCIEHLACLFLKQSYRLVQVLRTIAQIAAQSDIYYMPVHQSGKISIASP